MICVAQWIGDSLDVTVDYWLIQLHWLKKLYLLAASEVYCQEPCVSAIAKLIEATYQFCVAKNVIHNKYMSL